MPLLALALALLQPSFEERLLGTVPDGWLGWEQFAFSADGRKVAFQAVQDVEAKDRKNCAVVDGEAGDLFDHVHSFVWSPDGSQVAHAAKRGRKGLVVLGRKVIAEHDEVLACTLAFSPDGKTLAYAAAEGSKYFYVVGPRKGEEFDAVWPGAFSPNGKSFAYPALKSGKWCMVNGAARGPGFDSTILEFAWSPDGKTLAYATKELGRWFAVVGDRKGRPYDWVGGIRWDEKGRSPVYAALDGKRVVGFVGDRACSESAYEGANAYVMDAVLSADGKLVAFHEPRGDRKSAIVAAGRRGPEVEGYVPCSLAMSKDGRAAYLAREDGAYVLVVNGERVLRCQGAVRPVFSDDGRRVAVGCRIEREFWWRVFEVK